MGGLMIRMLGGLFISGVVIGKLLDAYFIHAHGANLPAEYLGLHTSM